jgi:hypothetical protein
MHLPAEERRLVANFSTYLAGRDFHISFVLMGAVRQYVHVNKAKFVIVSSSGSAEIARMCRLDIKRLTKSSFCNFAMPSIQEIPHRHPCEVALIKLIGKTLKLQETKFKQGKDRTSRNRDSLSNYAMLLEVHFISI